MKYWLIWISGRNLKLFELKTNSFQMLRVLETINIILADNVWVIEEGIVWRIDRSVWFFTAEDLLIAFRAFDVFPVILTDKTSTKQKTINLLMVFMDQRNALMVSIIEMKPRICDNNLLYNYRGKDSKVIGNSWLFCWLFLLRLVYSSIVGFNHLSKVRQTIDKKIFGLIFCS